MLLILLLLFNGCASKISAFKYKADRANKVYENLFEAVRDNNVEGVRKFLLSGEDVNMKDHAGRFPLQLASRLANIPIMKELLDNGADVNMADSLFGLTSLHAAIDSGNFQAISLLINKGANLNKLDIIQGETPFDFVIKKNDPSLIVFFLNHGALLNIEEVNEEEVNRNRKKMVSFSKLFPELSKFEKRGRGFRRHIISNELVEDIKRELLTKKDIIKAVNDDEYMKIINIILDIELKSINSEIDNSLLTYCLENIIDLERTNSNNVNAYKFIRNNIEKFQEEKKAEIIKKMKKKIIEKVNRLRRGF